VPGDRLEVALIEVGVEAPGPVLDAVRGEVPARPLAGRVEDETVPESRRDLPMPIRRRPGDHVGDEATAREDERVRRLVEEQFQGAEALGSRNAAAMSREIDTDSPATSGRATSIQNQLARSCFGHQPAR
jgi:hypothetical protein